MRKKMNNECDRLYQLGDVIDCKDRRMMAEKMLELLESGIDTEFCYEQNGKKGFWLVVCGYIRTKNRCSKLRNPIWNTEDRCVCCGEVIPEGRQVCPTCEKGKS